MATTAAVSSPSPHDAALPHFLDRRKWWAYDVPSAAALSMPMHVSRSSGAFMHELAEAERTRGAVLLGWAVMLLPWQRRLFVGKL
ncbi:MAG TPA: hypothetical protein VMZ31_20170 [Phycisphaerae bacterium]|nr:hypothetical protein [Phycisphaerae bacterium]